MIIDVQSGLMSLLSNSTELECLEHRGLYEFNVCDCRGNRGHRLIFDFTNGFHDAANSIATVVSTRVLSPGRAVALAAFFNFIAFFLGTTCRRQDRLQRPGRPEAGERNGGARRLIGARTWNLITWYLGLPTSSSHAIGGYAVRQSIAGFQALVFDAKWPRGWFGTISFIVISTIGLLAGLALMTAVFWIFRRAAPSRVDKYFR